METSKPSGKTFLNDVGKIVFATFMLVWLWVGLIVVSIDSCTIRPRTVESHEASFDGNVQNSGLIEQLPDGGYLITENARQRYNALIALYGAKMVPPITTDDGLTPGPTRDGKPTWIITKQRLVDFQTMSRLRRTGK